MLVIGISNTTGPFCFKASSAFAWIASVVSTQTGGSNCLNWQRKAKKQNVTFEVERKLARPVLGLIRIQKAARLEREIIAHVRGERVRRRVPTGLHCFMPAAENSGQFEDQRLADQSA